MMQLRPYQHDIVAEFHAVVERGHRRIIAVAPTGAGKTIIGAEIVNGISRKNSSASVLVLAHRREIITQTSGKLLACGIPHGVIQAGVRPRPLERVQIASIQTLWKRAMHTGNMELPPADLVWIDEAHRAAAKTYRKIIEAYPNAIILGTTATPCRGDGRGLGGIFDIIIQCPQVAELIRQSYLVHTRVYAPIDPDLSGVRTRRGDYVESELAARMDRAKLVGDIVMHWHKFGDKRKTIAFACSVQHSIHIRDEFIASGVRAEHIDGTTPKPERDATLARLECGEIDLVSNCMVLSEGWDMPDAGTLILARPTKQMGLYRQMVGRVLRPAARKHDAIVLDHSGAVFRHGFVEDPVQWTLDPDRHAENIATRGRESGTKASRLHECKNCGVVGIAGEPCWSCGYLPQRPPRAVRIEDGDLGLVDRHRRAHDKVYDEIERIGWHAMLVYIGLERGYSPKWPAANYREKFGTWPPWGSAPQPTPPTPEVRSWVHSRLIAYAKRRAAS